MQSSYKIIKNRDISDISSKSSLIETRIACPNKGRKKPQQMDEDMQEETIDYEEIQRQMQEETLEERLTILNMAREEAESITLKAREKGYEEGHSLGLDEGRKKGQEEAKIIKENAIKLMEEAQANVKKYYKDKRQEIIELAAKMAESIVHETIDSSNEDILLLINPLLERYANGGESIIITCNPRKMPIMRSKVAELEVRWKDIRFILLEDANLENNGCTIENEYQFVDMQISKQIEDIIEQINNME